MVTRGNKIGLCKREMSDIIDLLLEGIIKANSSIDRRFQKLNEEVERSGVSGV